MTSSPDAWSREESFEGPALPRQSPISAVPALADSAARRDDRWTDGFDPTTQARVKRDLAYASALLDAAERLRHQSVRPSLLSAIADEAAIIVEADEVAVVQYSGIRRHVTDVQLANHVDDPTFREAVQAATELGWLSAPGSTPDLAHDRRWDSRSGRLAFVPWRATMTVGLFSLDCQDQTRLVWFSDTPHAFDGQADLAGLLGRHANLALQALA